MATVTGHVGSEVAVLIIDRPLFTPRDRQTLRSQLDEIILLGGARRIVVDLGGVRWIGVPILDELIDAHQRLESMDRELAIVSEASGIKRMLQAARADRLKTFSSVRSATATPPVCAAV